MTDEIGKRILQFKSLCNRLAAVFDRVPQPIASIARSAWMVSMDAALNASGAQTHIVSESGAELIREAAKAFEPSKGGDILDLLTLITEWAENYALLELNEQ